MLLASTLYSNVNTLNFTYLFHLQVLSVSEGRHRRSPQVSRSDPMFPKIVPQHKSSTQHNVQGSKDLHIVQHCKHNLLLVWLHPQFLCSVKHSVENELAFTWTEIEVEQSNEGLLLVKDALSHFRVFGECDAWLCSELNEQVVIFVWITLRVQCELHHVDDVPNFRLFDLVHFSR